MRRWSFVAWLVFWSVLGVVLLISFLVQARERADAAEEEQRVDTAIAKAVVLRVGEPLFVQEGIATWYGPGFHGRRSASGRRFNMYELTAAHRWLPFGTLVRVSLPGQDTAVVVQITDRGPFVRQRIIDLSWAAARALGVRLHPVRIEAYLPPRESLSVLGFSAGWRPFVVERSAFVLLDTLTAWTEAVRRWEQHRQEFPLAWLLVGWASESDSSVERQSYELCFYIGVPQTHRMDTVLSFRE